MSRPQRLLAVQALNLALATARPSAGLIMIMDLRDRRGSALRPGPPGPAWDLSRG